jgi:hypothetical protein
MFSSPRVRALSVSLSSTSQSEHELRRVHAGDAASLSFAKSVVLPENATHATTSLWRRIGTQAPLSWKLEWTFPASPSCEGDDVLSRKDLVQGALHALQFHPDVAATSMTSDQLLELANIMASFSEWVQTNFPPGAAAAGPDQLFRRRATIKFNANRGRAATKCPLWHYDHVPFRWIQSLVGPGVDVVVSETAVNWPLLHSRIRGDHEDAALDRVVSVSERNRLLVPVTAHVPALGTVSADRAPTQTMPEGVPIILLGGRWNEWVENQRQNQATLASNHSGARGALTTSVLPAIHKSPTLRVPWQERVVVVMDIVE